MLSEEQSEVLCCSPLLSGALLLFYRKGSKVREEGRAHLHWYNTINWYNKWPPNCICFPTAWVPVKRLDRQTRSMRDFHRLPVLVAGSCCLFSLQAFDCRFCWRFYCRSYCRFYCRSLLQLLVTIPRYSSSLLVPLQFLNGLFECQLELALALPVERMHRVNSPLAWYRMRPGIRLPGKTAMMLLCSCYELLAIRLEAAKPNYINGKAKHE